MRHRLVLLAGLAAGALLAPLAAATPSPQIVDPAGDAVGGRAGHDIVSVAFDTTDAEFVVTFEFAGPPEVAPGTRYSVWAQHSTCGSFNMGGSWAAVRPGPSVGFGPVGSGEHYLCGGPGDPNSDAGAGQVRPQVATDGNTLSLSVPLATLPAEFEGGTLSGLNASTTPAEPLLGGGPYGSLAAFDHASSTATYEVGS